MTMDLIGTERIAFPGLAPGFDGDSFRLAAIRCFNENRNPFKGALGSAICSTVPILRKQVVANDGSPGIRDAVLQKAYHNAQGRIGEIKFSIDPFFLDGIDLVDFIVARDQDHATWLNDQGASKATTFTSHRIHAQMTSLGKIAPEDIDGISSVFAVHAKQMAKVIANHESVDVASVLEVFRQRGAAIFASRRILRSLDHDLDFSVMTFMWSDNRAIYVHLGDRVNPKDNPISRFRDSELLNGEYADWARDFYRTNRRFVSDGTRKINGTDQRYVSLKLPRAPFVADRLIEIIKLTDDEALIAKSVYTLSRMNNDDFLPPMTTRPTSATGARLW